MNANTEQPLLADLDKRLFEKFVEDKGKAVRRKFELRSNLDRVGQDEVWNDVLLELWLRWSTTGGSPSVTIKNLIGYWIVSLQNRACTYLKSQARRKWVSLPQDDVLPSPPMSARLGTLEASEVCLQFFTELTDLQVQIFRLHVVDGYSIRKIVACKLCDGNRPLKKHGVVKHLKAIEVKALKFRSGYN